MIVTFRDLLTAAKPFQKLTEEAISIKLAYTLRRFLSVLQNELDFFWQQRDKIVSQFPPDDKRTIEDTKKIESELDELLNMEIKLEHDKISIHTTENIKITIQDMTNLEKFVEFVE